MTSQLDWEADLRARAAKQRVAIVCGTGVSAALSDGAKCSTWAELIESGLDYVGSLSREQEREAAAFKQMLPGASSDTYIAVAEWLSSQLKREEPGEYFDWLRRTAGSLEIANNDFGFLRQLDIPILTTNYDSLLEEVTDRAPMTWTDRYKIDRFHDNPAAYAFHLHGHWETPESVIFSGADYQRLAANQTTTQIMESLAATHTMLMVGYGAGLQDPNFNSFISWFAENYGATVRRIYVLCRQSDMPSKTLDGKIAYLCYGEKYSELPTYLEQFLPRTEPDTTEGVTSNNPPEDTVDVLASLPSTVRDLAAMPRSVIGGVVCGVS